MKMNVGFDRGVLMKVDPRKIRTYLEEKDWRMTFSAPGSYDSYSMGDEEILVPANTDFATYAVNVRQILNAVSRVEGRSPEEVLADIENAEAAAGASVEYTVKGVRDGMIPAAVMEWLIGTHRDMTAAVCDGTEAYNVLGDVMMRVDGSDIRFLHGPRTAKAVPGMFEAASKAASGDADGVPPGFADILTGLDFSDAGIVVEMRLGGKDASVVLDGEAFARIGEVSKKTMPQGGN